MLDDTIRKQVNDVFAGLKEPVDIIFFSKKENCQYCSEIDQLLTEVSALSEKISLQKYDIDEAAPLAEQLHVEEAPTFVLAGKNEHSSEDFGIRFVGAPFGHEFTSLINDILLVSGRESGLNEKTKHALKELTQPVKLQVFITPTCPYCPRAVVLAHQMAMESPYVQAEMVEAMEFPELADRYGVSGVPHTTINDGAGTLVGAAPEETLLAEIQKALG